MRKLTSHEKINLRSAFARKGIMGTSLLKLDCELAVYCGGYATLAQYRTTGACFTRGVIDLAIGAQSDQTN